MKIEYYKSAICPRCAVVTRTLAELEAKHPELEIERMEIFTHPARTLKAGVRGIPALRVGDDLQSWFLPKREEVLEFLQPHLP